MVKTIALDREAGDAVRRQVTHVATLTKQEEQALLARAAVDAQELPRQIREAVYEFKHRETDQALLITNNPIYPGDIEPTPRDLPTPTRPRVLTLGHILHVLYGCLLGEPYGFETAQYGRSIQDLIPINGADGNSVLGHGDVGLHTEDFSRPFIPDYVGFGCLRNDERAITVLSSVAGVEFPGEIRDTLMHNRFTPVSGGYGPAEIAEPQHLLFGDPQRPYLRYRIMNTVNMTEPMATAAAFLARALDANRTQVCLSQGDSLFVDNYTAVHGRQHYDPRDSDGRWFCRLLIARDLRRTREYRSEPASRTVQARWLLKGASRPTDPRLQRSEIAAKD